MPRIDISWEGPLSAEQAENLVDQGRDYGVYAAYGGSPTYGPGAVLYYIGEANVQTFGARIGGHVWRYGGWWYGGIPMQFHVGRLCGQCQPGADKWEILIKVAERLLIHTHRPLRNSQHIRELNLQEGYTDTHVFNWGYHGDLLPEVSSARWYENPYDAPHGIDNIWALEP